MARSKTTRACDSLGHCLDMARGAIVMARGMAQPAKAAGNDKLKVFISYSRRDAVAADALVAALTARDFDVKIDTRDLPFGEEWQKELAEFIRLSDTVIWLVSDASIRSEWVNWELDEVKARNKRLVPVMAGLVNPAELPRQLGAIHILPRDRIFDLARDLNTLVEVLETDHAWLKQATRWQDRATEWLAKGRASALLLSRGALTEAESWKDTRPPKAPAPAQEVLELLLASRHAATRRQRWWVGGSLTVALGAIALAGIAVYQAILAEARRTESESLREQSQRTESRLLSNAAALQRSDATDLDAPTAAALLAIEALPDAIARNRRPHVASAEVQLALALDRIQERNIEPLQAMPVEVRLDSTKTLAVAIAGSESATLYDVEAARQIASLKLGQRVLSASPSLSPAGPRVNLVTDQSRMRWDFASNTMTVMETFPEPAIKAIDAPDSTTVILFRNRVVLQARDSETEAVTKVLPGTPIDLTVSQDGSTVVALFPRGEVRIYSRQAGDWTEKTGKLAKLGDEVFTYPTGRDASNKIAGLSLSATGNSLAVWHGQRIWIYDVALWTLKFSRVEDQFIGSVAFSADASMLGVTKRLRFGSSPGTRNEVEFIDSTNYSTLLRKDIPDWPTSAGFVASDLFFVAGANFGTWLLGIKTEQITRFPFASSYVAELGKRGMRELLFAQANRISIIESGKRNLISMLHQERARIISTSRDGRTLAIAPGPLANAGQRKIVSIRDWYMPAPSAMSTVKIANVRAIAALSPDESIYLSTRDGVIQWQARSDEATKILPQSRRVYGLALSPDQTLLAVATDTTIEVVRTSDKAVIRTLASHVGLDNLEFSPDARFLVAPLANTGEVAIWSTDTDDNMVLHAAHSDRINTVRFATDGTFVTTSDDKTAKLWDGRSHGLKATLEHDCFVKSALFLAGGERVVTATDCGLVSAGEIFVWAQGADAKWQVVSIYKFDSGVSWISAGPTVELGRSVLAVATRDGVHSLEVFITTQALIDRAKERFPRCLRQSERAAYGLPAAPPTWCVERRLWPYHSDEWHNHWLPKQKAWLASGRHGEPPALPKSQEPSARTQ